MKSYILEHVKRLIGLTCLYLFFGTASCTKLTNTISGADAGSSDRTDADRNYFDSKTDSPPQEAINDAPDASVAASPDADKDTFATTEDTGVTTDVTTSDGNTETSESQQCPSGFQPDGKGGCEDIDECELNHGDCDPTVTCTNTPGSYFCGDCPEDGYESEGVDGCVKLWPVQLGTVGYDESLGIAADAENNVYITGWTEGVLEGNTSAGGADLFVAKYSNNGSKKWLRQIGTINPDNGNDIATDSDNNVYITGYTNGGLDTNASTGDDDIFIAKYNNQGNKQWTRQFGTTEQDQGWGIAVDSNNNIYVTGWTWGSLDDNANIGNVDIFVVKYSNQGAELWTRQLGTADVDEGTSVASDRNNNIYVTGYTDGELDGNRNASGDFMWDNDVFVVKYDSQGNKQWSRQFGTAEEDVGWDIAADGEDNVYITGWTWGGLDGNANSGGEDIFVTKYDGQGNKQWTQQIGTTDDDEGLSIATDSQNNVYITGYAGAALDRNAFAGTTDVVTVKYDSLGNEQWTRLLGTTEWDEGNGVTVDSNGDVYITGYVKGELKGNTYEGARDIIVIKYDSAGNLM